MVFRAPGESPTPRSLRSHDRLDRLDRLDRPVQSGLFAVCSPCNRPCKHRLLPCKEERRKEAGKRVIARPHRTAPPGGPEVAVRTVSPESPPPPLTTESPTTHYCTVQPHVPIDPYAERMPRADCSSNTIRDSISRVAPSLRGPRFAPALRHARRPCALTRGRPAVPRQPGTGRSRRTARRAALAPAVLR